VPYTQITEQGAISFIKPGMSEKEVTDKVGKPNRTESQDDGVEAWTYLTGPLESTKLSYKGFEVFFKEKKVTSRWIIRGHISN
jgi:hypothetical protein